MKINEMTQDWIEQEIEVASAWNGAHAVRNLRALAVARTALQRIADTGRAPERVVARRALDTEVGDS